MRLPSVMHLTLCRRTIRRIHPDVLDQDPTHDAVQKNQTTDHRHRDARGRRERNRGQAKEEHADADDERVVAVREKVNAEGVRTLREVHRVIDWRRRQIEVEA